MNNDFFKKIIAEFGSDKKLIDVQYTVFAEHEWDNFMDGLCRLFKKDDCQFNEKPLFKILVMKEKAQAKAERDAFIMDYILA